jgi:hypothetical protein
MKNFRDPSTHRHFDELDKSSVDASSLLFQLQAARRMFGLPFLQSGPDVRHCRNVPRPATSSRHV